MFYDFFMFYEKALCVYDCECTIDVASIVSKLSDEYPYVESSKQEQVCLWFVQLQHRGRWPHIYMQ